jgi:hypothetical protein
MSETAVMPGDAARIAELEREVDRLRLRALVVRLVAAEISDFVVEDDLWVVVDDVIARWLARAPDDPQELAGARGFWSRYAGAVEYAPPGSDSEFRMEFADHDDGTDGWYFLAVWADHVGRLQDQH